ncbi:MAG TPA: hypothetical protein VFS90_17225 [Pyrinomonadaceae bacterium]|nr:hypothetical protein [Pyrinomonadaceae bacterium]
MKRSLLSVSLTICFASVASAQGVCSRFRAVPGRCDLNAAPVEQAKCLLRPVNKFGHLGEPLRELPGSLGWLVGDDVFGIEIEQLRILIDAHGISEADLGGSFSTPLPNAKYFVIHDTSDLLQASEFPPDINSKSASLNNLSRRVTTKVAHVYINRAGQSVTAVAFDSATPPSGTKLGLCNRAPKTAFLQVELIQPRIRDRSVRFPNDAIAPEVGFTEKQIERLAFIYVAASLRAGKWLIPAYHSPLDLGFPDRHDDPQNFDLESWAMHVAAIIVVGGHIHGSPRP